jgi:HPt (histidine-containing phosphotransfer) domain-containing protein
VIFFFCFAAAFSIIGFIAKFFETSPLAKAPAKLTLNVFLRQEAPGEVNFSRVLERFGGGEKWLESVRLYAACTPVLLAGLKKMNHEPRPIEYLDHFRIALHGVKGSSRAIGAEKTGRMAEKLEEAAAKGDMDFISSNMEGFLKNTKHLIARFRELLKAADQQFIKPKKPVPDKEFLGHLLEVAGIYNAAKQS